MKALLKERQRSKFSVNSARASLRTMRVVHFAFLFTVVLYLWVPSMLKASPPKESPKVLAMAMGAVSLTSIGAVLFFQAQRVRPSAERLQLNPDDRQAAAEWRTGLMLCFVFSETAALLGLASRILGVSWSIAGIFYGVGALMLMLCTPKLELLPG